MKTLDRAEKEMQHERTTACKRRMSTEDFHTKIIRIIYKNNDQSYYSIHDLTQILCNDKTRGNVDLLRAIAKQYGIEHVDTMTKRMLCQKIGDKTSKFGFGNYLSLKLPSVRSKAKLDKLRNMIGTKLHNDFIYTAVHSHDKDRFDIRRDASTKAWWLMDPSLTAEPASESIFANELDEIHTTIQSKGKTGILSGELDAEAMTLLHEMQALVLEMCKRVDAYTERISKDKEVKDSIQSMKSAVLAALASDSES